MNELNENKKNHYHRRDQDGNLIRELNWKARRREQAILDFFGNEFGHDEYSNMMRNPPEHISSALDSIVGGIEKKLNNPVRQLAAEWAQYLPEPLCSGSRPKFIRKDGTLIIEADNSTLMFSLKNYYGRELQMKIRQRFPDEIRQLMFVSANYDKRSK